MNSNYPTFKQFLDYASNGCDLEVVHLKKSYEIIGKFKYKAETNYLEMFLHHAKVLSLMQ